MTKPTLDYVELMPGQAPIASIIWLHGLGADGHDFANIVPELNLAKEFAIRFIFPHAPVRPVTINAGYMMRAWYDITGFDLQSREDESGIRQSQQAIHELIEFEKKQGIPSERIILAGFSQGGAIALHTGLRYPEKLGGILALSTYLPLNASLPQEASAINKDISIFMAHGDQDNIVPLTYAQIAKQFLVNNGHQVEFHTYPMAHSVCAEEIVDIAMWLRTVLQ